MTNIQTPPSARTYFGQAMRMIDSEDFHPYTRYALENTKESLTEGLLTTIVGATSTCTLWFPGIILGLILNNDSTNDSDTRLRGRQAIGGPVTLAYGLSRLIKNSAEWTVYSVANVLGYDEL